MTSTLNQSFYDWLSSETNDGVASNGVESSHFDPIFESETNDLTAASDFVIRSSLDAFNEAAGPVTDLTNFGFSFVEDSFHPGPFAQGINSNLMEGEIIDLGAICNTVGIQFEGNNFCSSPASYVTANEKDLFKPENEQLLTTSHECIELPIASSNSKENSNVESISKNLRNDSRVRCERSGGMTSSADVRTAQGVSSRTSRDKKRSAEGSISKDSFRAIEKSCGRWMDSTIKECENLCSNLKSVSSTDMLKTDRNLKIELTKVYYSCKQFMDFVAKSKRSINSLCEKRKRTYSEDDKDARDIYKSERTATSATKRMRTSSAKEYDRISSDHAYPPRCQPSPQNSKGSQVQDKYQPRKIFPEKEDRRDARTKILDQFSLRPLAVSTPRKTTDEDSLGRTSKNNTPYRIPKKSCFKNL